MNPDEQKIPTDTREAIEAYVHYGTHPDVLGSFLRALLTNDLRGAVLSADEKNAANIVATVRWVYMNVPGPACGSRERMIAWHHFRKGKAA